MASTPSEPVAPAGDDNQPANLSHRQIVIILLGVVSGMFLAALDQNIVGIALPRIVSDIGGLEYLSWVVTAYLLTSTATTPLWGKFSDLYGRRIIFQIAIVIFMVGSALSGTSQDLTQLIIFRAIQGIGGGGLFAIAFAIIGDIVPPRERGRYQGYFGAVFGVSSLAGPLLGGWLTDGPGWRWIFYLNIPIGIVALVVTSTALRLPVQRRERSIDWLGAGAIVGGVSSLLLYLNWAGRHFGWAAPQALALAGLAVTLAIVFVLIERRAREPIIPMALFSNSIFRVGAIFSFLFGFAMFGGFIFLPVFLQTSRGMTATASGLSLFPAVLGILMLSITTGHLVTRTGRYRIFPVVGTAIMTFGIFLMSRLGVETPYWQIAVSAFVLGTGLGMSMQTITVAVQNAVPFRDLGTATSAVTFLRSLGGAIGVAFLGAVFGIRLTHHMGDISLEEGQSANNVDAILALPDEVRIPVVEAYARAVNDLFVVSIPFGLAALVTIWFLKEIPLRTTSAATSGPRDDASPDRVSDAEAEASQPA